MLQPTYQNTSVVHEKVAPSKYTATQSYASHSPGYTSSQTAGYGRTTGGRGNLSELDTLLDDLSNARYGNYVEKNAYTERNGKCFPIGETVCSERRFGEPRVLLIENLELVFFNRLLFNI